MTFKLPQTKWLIAIIVAVGFFIYANSLFNDFVWDDEEQVVNNTVIRDWSNLRLVLTSSTFYAGGAGLSGGFYRPLVSLSYFINYHLWGPNPAGYRFIQLLFHLGNAALIYFLLERVLSIQEIKFRRGISFLIALVFTIHPANVESVVYIGSIGEVAYAFCILLAMYLFIKRIDYSSRNISHKTLIISFALIFLGLLAKETAIAAIPILFLYLWLFIKPPLKIYLKMFFASAVISGFYVFLRLFVAKIPTVPANYAPITHATALERILTAPYTVYSYIKVIFFPQILSISRHFVIRGAFDYHFWAISLLLLVVCVALFIILRQKVNQAVVFFLFWFAISIFPTLNIVPLDMTMAERWLYIPIIGIIAAVIIGLAPYIIHLRPNLRLAAALFFVLLFCFLCVRTVSRNEDWKNGLSLFSHDIALADLVSPQGSFDLENNVGVELFRAGEIDKAGEHFKKSIALQPHWSSAQNNLGAVLERQGDLAGALSQYRKAIEQGDYYLAYENIGNILIKTKQFDEAKKFIKRSLEKKFPQNAKLAIQLAIIYAASDNPQERQDARAIAASILKQDPANPQALQIYYLIQNNQKLEL